ncbi:MAG TPA: polysaccharide biosynthesis tyrosine autokinase [Tepidisphaeraceae bacterium]|jgi:capsular exopolysaccharide synthesis family protein
MTTLPQVQSVRLPRAAGGPGGALAHHAPAQPVAGMHMTAGDIWRLIRANLWLIITLVVVATAAGIVANMLLARWMPRYTSTGIIQVQSTAALTNIDPIHPEVVGPGLDQAAVEMEQKTQASLLTSPQLIGAVLANPESKIRQTSWFAGFRGDIESAKMNLLSHLEVNPVPETKLITVSIAEPKPEDAQTIVQDIVDEHIREQREVTLNRQLSRSQLLTNMKDSAQARLNEIQRDLRESTIALNIGGMGEPGRLSAKEVELSELLHHQLDTEEFLQKAESKYQETADALQKGDTPPEVEDYMDRNPAVLAAQQAFNNSDMNYTMMASTWGSDNPRLQQMAKQRDSLQQKLDETKASVRATYSSMELGLLREDVQQYQRVQTELQKRIDQSKSDLGELNNKMSQYLTAQDEEKSLDELVKGVDRQLDEITQINNQADLASVVWMQPPDVPAEMSFPKMWMTLSIAIFLGLGAALGIAFTREAMDTTVRSPRDVARVGQLNLLGMIPDEQDDPQATGGRLPMIINDAPQSMMAEQFRQVRTRLQHAAPLDTTRSIMVTSPSPGDGKTTIAANLATGLALNGRKVLLVDANFRRPELHKLFGVAGGSGFGEALASTDKFEAGVRPTQVQGLSVMPLGNKPKSATELLESQLFADFVERALKDYDHVIFDASPLLLASDAMAMAPRVDGVVTVVRAQANSRGLLQRLRDTLRQIKAENLGVVLNGVRSQGGGYYGRNIKTYYAYQNGGVE